MDYLRTRRERVEGRLETVLDDVEPPGLAEQVRHVSLSGGKRVRPLMTLLACEAAGGQVDEALDYAVGIELVHNASLVVDDIIDESDVRRGVPSVWTKYGHGPAIVASDGLLGEAFGLFEVDADAMATVAEALVELGEGEATELVDRPTDRREYVALARRKTGALFRAAAELGAIAAGADGYSVEAFGQYAERVGIAFQVRDDVLDATGDPEDLGKPTGRDAELDRPSIVQVTDLSPGEANDLAHDYSDAALEALATTDVPESGTGPRAQATEYLRDLAEFVVVRER